MVGLAGLGGAGGNHAVVAYAHQSRNNSSVVAPPKQNMTAMDVNNAMLKLIQSVASVDPYVGRNINLFA